MKKALSVLLASAMLLLPSCAQEAENGSSEAPVSSEIVSKPKQEGFFLESLPDIGEYTGVKGSYFYGEPLDEFRPSDEYGNLIPYKAGGKYGFLSSDGRIITSPCYQRLYPLVSRDGKQAVYFAGLSMLCADGFSWDKFDRGERVFTFALISPDGSRYTVIESTSAEMMSLFGSVDGVMFETAEGSAVYDLAGNLIASLSGVRHDPWLSRVELVKDGAVYRLYYTDPDADGDFCVCTFDGETQDIRSVRFDAGDSRDKFFVGVYGDVLLGVGDGYFVADLNGHVLFSLPEDKYYAAICHRADRSFVGANPYNKYIDFYSADGEWVDSVTVTEEPWATVSFDGVKIDDENVVFVSDRGTLTYSLRDGTFTGNVDVPATSKPLLSLEDSEDGSAVIVRRSDGKEAVLTGYFHGWFDYEGESFVLLHAIRYIPQKNGCNDEVLDRFLFYDAETLSPVLARYTDGATVGVVGAADGKTYFSCYKNGAVTVLDEMFEVVGVVPVTVTD